MKQHQYHVTIQHLADAQGNPSTYTEKLEFNTGNHDDIFVVLQKLQQAELFNERTTQSFAVGLKLFSEVMPENKNHELFQDFLPQFGQFMKHLKQQVKKES